jgi:hypothetical protein
MKVAVITALLSTVAAVNVGIGGTKGVSNKMTMLAPYIGMFCKSWNLMSAG